MNNLLKMGVLNITPNSFSDGNKYNSKSKFKEKFIELSSWVDIIDIGAESTAPMNPAIPAEEEIERYKSIFFPYLYEYEDPKLTLSIDTYKVSVFKVVCSEIHKYWPETKVIFNDISGQVDDELIDLLNNKDYKFDYILSHNLAPNRIEAANHMNYCTDLKGHDFVIHVQEFFNERARLLSPFKDRVYFDPCFGFSKTREQNHILLANFNMFLAKIPESFKIVYGISKKSFLRFPRELNIQEPENLAVVEHMHTYFLADIISNNASRNFVFRLHSKEVVKAVLDVLAILKFKS